MLVMGWGRSREAVRYTLFGMQTVFENCLDLVECRILIYLENGERFDLQVCVHKANAFI